MRVCEFCSAENLDSAKHCASCNEPMTAEAAREDVKVAEKHTHQTLVRKEVLYGVGGVVIAIGLVVALVRHQREKALESSVRDFYTTFREVDDAHVPQFWKCITRSEMQPKDNIELESMLESAIVKSKGGYAKHARTKCLPLVVSAPGRLESIVVPSFLADSYDAYIAAIKALQKDAENYINNVDAIEQTQPKDAALKRLASNYHNAETDSAEKYAYDKFLRCAVPNMAGMADEQGILEYLSSVMKDPVPTVQKWRQNCYPFVEKTEGTTADPDYKKKLEALMSDDRDVNAFQDVLKAANDKQRKAGHAPFQQAWYRYAKARDDQMARFGEYLGR